MINEKRLIKSIIKFVEKRAVTTIKEICEEFGISKTKFYHIKQRRFGSSITENKKYITTTARIKKCTDENGFYRHGNLIFHRKDDVKEVIVELVGKSGEGLPHSEIEKLIEIQCYRQLDQLQERKRITSVKVGKHTVYFTKRKWKQQLRERLNKDLQDPQVETLDISEFTAILDDMQPFSDHKRMKHEYSPLAKFKALCTLFALNLDSFQHMEYYLDTNERIRTACCGDDPRVIDHTTLCRFMGTLTEEELTAIFVQLVKECHLCDIINGTYLAVDATHLFAWCNTQRDTNKHPVEGASWGRKSRKFSFFGYKLHLIVDCEAELPIAFIISTGKDHDSQHFIPLLKFTKEHYGDLVENAELFSDSAYWQANLVKKAKVILKAELYSAINPRRDKIWKHLKRAIRLFFISYDRAPVTHEELMSVLNQETLDKYGIELDQRIEVEHSKLMRAVKERMNRQYRAAVERVFSRLKWFFRLNSLRARRFPSVKKSIILSMISMLLMALAMKERGIPLRKQKFVRIH